MFDQSLKSVANKTRVQGEEAFSNILLFTFKLGANHLLGFDMTHVFCLLWLFSHSVVDEPC